MANDIADISQEQSAQELKRAAQELKEKAKVAGIAAWDVTKATYQQLQSKTKECTQATDKAIRTNPYISLSVAFGVGLLLGAIFSRPKVVERD